MDLFLFFFLEKLIDTMIKAELHYFHHVQKLVFDIYFLVNLFFLIQLSDFN